MLNTCLFYFKGIFPLGKAYNVIADGDDGGGVSFFRVVESSSSRRRWRGGGRDRAPLESWAGARQGTRRWGGVLNGWLAVEKKARRLVVEKKADTRAQVGPVAR
jgi:hypothetical protein